LRVFPKLLKTLRIQSFISCSLKGGSNLVAAIIY
jgi:hypothetical protein